MDNLQWQKHPLQTVAFTVDEPDGQHKNVDHRYHPQHATLPKVSTGRLERLIYRRSKDQNLDLMDNKKMLTTGPKVLCFIFVCMFWFGLKIEQKYNHNKI